MYVYLIVDKVATLISTLCAAEICEGNPEERFVNLPNIHKDTLKDVSRKSYFMYVCMYVLFCSFLF